MWGAEHIRLRHHGPQVETGTASQKGSSSRGERSVTRHKHGGCVLLTNRARRRGRAEFRVSLPHPHGRPHGSRAVMCADPLAPGPTVWAWPEPRATVRSGQEACLWLGGCRGACGAGMRQFISLESGGLSGTPRLGWVWYHGVGRCRPGR